MTTPMFVKLDGTYVNVRNINTFGLNQDGSGTMYIYFAGSVREQGTFPGRCFHALERFLAGEGLCDERELDTEAVT